MYYYIEIMVSEKLSMLGNRLKFERFFLHLFVNLYNKIQPIRMRITIIDSHARITIGSKHVLFYTFSYFLIENT